MSALTNHRTLVEIGDDLGCAIRYRTGGMLEIGQLLNEAKEQATHGEWLPFLKLYRIEPRSAQNYMKAATWADAWAAANTKHVSYLENITPKAIYALASGQFADNVVEQVISASQLRHIGIADVKQIAKIGDKATILREIKAAQDAEAEAEMAARLAEAKAAGFDTVEAYEAAIKAAEKEARQKQRQEQAGKKSTEQADDDDDDGDDDADDDDGEDDDDSEDTEETNEPSPAHLRAIAKFDEAVEMLRSVMTKSLAVFDDTKAPTDVVDEVSRFLEEVGHRRKQKLHTDDAPIDASKLN
jgi:hypothetical protein